MASGGLLCWSCGQPTGIEIRVARNDSCENCMADLRCCRGCRHFDPLARSQCRETIDAPIPQKDKSNFCDFFQMRKAIKGPGGIVQVNDDKKDRKGGFDDLFKD